MGQWIDYNIHIKKSYKSDSKLSSFHAREQINKRWNKKNKNKNSWPQAKIDHIRWSEKESHRWNHIKKVVQCSARYYLTANHLNPGMTGNRRVTVLVIPCYQVQKPNFKTFLLISLELKSFRLRIKICFVDFVKHGLNYNLDTNRIDDG